MDPARHDAIRAEALRPVQAIEKEILRLESTYAPESKYATTTLPELRRSLAEAKRQAAAQLFVNMNARRTGADDSQIDFHGLSAADAKARFDETVMPVLPVLGQVTIIVGRGKHSQSGTSVLRPVVLKRAEHHGVQSEVSADGGSIIIRHGSGAARPASPEPRGEASSSGAAASSRVGAGMTCRCDRPGRKAGCGRREAGRLQQERAEEGTSCGHSGRLDG